MNQDHVTQLILTIKDYKDEKKKTAVDVLESLYHCFDLGEKSEDIQIVVYELAHIIKEIKN